MKNSIKMIALIPFYFFMLTGQGDSILMAQTLTNSERCKHSRPFGDINVCLPTITGMTECYSNPSIRRRADNLYQVGSTVLGAYLNNQIYGKIENLDEIVFDDYFFVYAPNKLLGAKIGTSELDNIFNLMTGNYLKENWEELKGKIEKFHDYLVSIGKPIILESYAPNDKIRTGIFLTKMTLENKEMISIAILNVMEIKQRMIFSSYTLTFDGEGSIKAAKTKNEDFASKFLIENR